MIVICITGLALINGTQFISALGTEALERARNIALQADVVAAMTLEALQGTSRAFDEAIHSARPHRGQQAVAGRLRKLLQYGGNSSEITGQVLRVCKSVEVNSDMAWPHRARVLDLVSRILRKSRSHLTHITDSFNLKSVNLLCSFSH